MLISTSEDLNLNIGFIEVLLDTSILTTFTNMFKAQTLMSAVGLSLCRHRSLLVNVVCLVCSRKC